METLFKYIVVGKFGLVPKYEVGDLVRFVDASTPVISHDNVYVIESVKVHPTLGVLYSIYHDFDEGRSLVAICISEKDLTSAIKC